MALRPLTRDGARPKRDSELSNGERARLNQAQENRGRLAERGTRGRQERRAK